jgi:hypothetical protein
VKIIRCTKTDHGTVCGREQVVSKDAGITLKEARSIGWNQTPDGDWHCPHHSGTKAPS